MLILTGCSYHSSLCNYDKPGAPIEQIRHDQAQCEDEAEKATENGVRVWGENYRIEHKCMESRGYRHLDSLDVSDNVRKSRVNRTTC